MRIHDEELGPMRWHVQLNGEKITAEAVVETTRVQELLRTHQDLLESKLNALGVQVEDFEVSVDNGSNRYAALLEQKKCRLSERSGEDNVCPDDSEPSTMKTDSARNRGLDLYV
jgi:flagellar hook-length control protein FliK